MYGGRDHIDGIVRDAYGRLLEVINKSVKVMRDDTKKMSDHVIANSTGLPPTTVQPDQLDYKDYQHLKYWFEHAWQALRHQSGLALKELSPDSPIISVFMEDEFGEPIPEALKSKLRGDLTAYWNDVHDTGEVLKRWSDLGLRRKDHFRKTFEAKYPWLRLCEANWKVDHLWINYFRTWRKNHPELGPSPEPANKHTTHRHLNIKPATPEIDITDSPATPEIDITDSSSDTTRMNAKHGGRDPVSKTTTKRPTTIDITDDSSEAGNNAKRRRTNQEAPASRGDKGKGKAVDVMEPAKFHPPRPQPRLKSRAKVAKVSVFLCYI